MFTLKSQLNSIRCCTPALAAVLSLQGGGVFDIQVVQEQSPGSFPRPIPARGGAQLVLGEPGWKWGRFLCSLGRPEICVQIAPNSPCTGQAER